MAGLARAIHVFVATALLSAKSDVMGGRVYILTNRRNGTLCVGSTVDLARRVWEHREGVPDGFTKRYGLSRLVYAESSPNVLIEKFERSRFWSSLRGAERRSNLDGPSATRTRLLRPARNDGPFDLENFAFTALIYQDNPEWEDFYDWLA
jgi:putative endonuclease